MVIQLLILVLSNYDCLLMLLAKKKKIHFKTSQTQLVQKSYLVMQQGYKERYVILQFFTGQSIMFVKTELRKIAEIEKNQNLILI